MNKHFVLEFSKAVDMTKTAHEVAALILNRIPDGIDDDINEAQDDIYDAFGISASESDNYNEYSDALADEIADAILSMKKEDLAEVIRGRKNAHYLTYADDEDDDVEEEADDEEEENW